MVSDPLSRLCRWLHWLLIRGLLSLCLLLTASLAQVPTAITPDGTLGTTVTQDGAVYNIDGGTIRGPNQFHSFDRFSVGTDDTASFNGPSSIENIVSRVTGGHASDIDGALRSTIDGANLFLLNPAGVIFGPHATLRVTGSFHVSTADSLRFADGAVLSVRLGEAGALTVAPPAAFGFLHANPAGIATRGSTLEVQPRQTMSIVGGDITIRGGMLRSPSGRINIASVASAGEVVLDAAGQPLGLDVESFDRLGRIDVVEEAQIDASGASGGTVVIRSGRMQVNNALIFANTQGNMDGAEIGIDIHVAEEIVLANQAFIVTNTIGAGDAGAVRVTAGSLQMDDAAIGSTTSAAGHAGRVVVDATTMTLTGGAQIGSITQGPGRGGPVTVRAAGAVRLEGTSPDGSAPSGIVTQAFGMGDAGAVLVEANRVMLSDGSEINSITQGPGHGGAVTVRATDTVTLAAGNIGTLAQGNAAGAAGDVLVDAASLTLIDGASIVSITQGPKRGGRVTVRATDTMLVAGASLVLTATSGPGDAGAVLVEADTVRLSDGSLILSTTSGPGPGGTVMVQATDSVTLAASSIGTRTRGEDAGAAGNVLVDAATVRLEGNALITSATFGTGRGSNVTVRTTDSVTLVASNIVAEARETEVGAAGDVLVEAAHVTLADGARISTRTFSPTPGGNVTVHAAKVTLTSGAQINSSTSGPGRGGNVTVRATDTVTLTGAATDQAGRFVPSRIVALAEGRQAGAGDAGNVMVHAANATLTAGAQINTSTFGPGQGGNVTVRATDTVTLEGTFLNMFASQISADTVHAPERFPATETGVAGSILVEAATVTLTGGARISSSSLGTAGSKPGRGGSVTVRATDAVMLAGGFIDPDGSFSPSAILAVAQETEAGAGSAGNVLVEATNVMLTGGAQINSSTGGPGRGGDVTVHATDTVTLAGGIMTPDRFASSGIGSQAQGTEAGAGNAGSVLVETASLTLSGGALISSDTLGPGQGGSVTVRATDSVTLIGGAVASDGRTFISSGISARADGPEAGAAGNIVVNAASVTLRDGAQINSETEGSGQGGDVTVRATDTVVISGGSAVSASSDGSGDAGNITIGAGNTIRLDNGGVATQATQAQGGNITLQADNFLILLIDSTIASSVRGGPGTTGGNIDIRAPFVVSQQQSNIRTTAQQGDGGAITIDGEVALLGPASNLDVSSVSGISGTVDIQAPVTSLTGVVAPLPQDFVQAAALLRQRCAQRLRQGNVSTLVARGRDGVPIEPGGVLPSSFAALPAADGTAGVAYEAHGLYQKALQHLHAALAQTEHATDPVQRAAILGRLGNVYLAIGATETAEQHLRQALDLVRTLAQEPLAAGIWNDLGNLFMVQNAPQDALAAYHDSAQHAQRTGQPLLAAKALSHAAMAALQRQQYHDAKRLLDTAMSHVQNVRQTASDHPFVLINLALTFHALLKDAANSAQARADLRAASYAWGYLGTLCEAEHRDQEALNWTRKAAFAAQQARAPESQFRWQWQTARLLATQGQRDAAIDAYRRAVSTLQTVRGALSTQYGRRRTSFRDTVGAIYFELVDLLLQRAAVLAEAAPYLHETRQTVEAFKVAELREYFGDECIDAGLLSATPLESVAQDAVIVIPSCCPIAPNSWSVCPQA